MVPETGIEPVRRLAAERRILSPLCLPISPLGRAIEWMTRARYCTTRKREVRQAMRLSQPLPVQIFWAQSFAAHDDRHPTGQKAQSPPTRWALWLHLEAGVGIEPA